MQQTPTQLVWSSIDAVTGAIRRLNVAVTIANDPPTTFDITRVNDRLADVQQAVRLLTAHVGMYSRPVDTITLTAAEMFGVDPADVTPDQRRTAKTAIFAGIYGQQGPSRQVRDPGDMEGR